MSPRSGTKRPPGAPNITADPFRPTRGATAASGEGGAVTARVRVRRGMGEFLLLPLAVVLGYLVLGGFTVVVDKVQPSWLIPVRHLLEAVISPGSASSLLAAIATSIVTVTSITFSVLLLAVQQTASTMTPSVFDQYLRRRSNQLYLGTFAGLSLYAFVDLASVGAHSPAIFGAAVGLLLTGFAMVILVVVIYSTIDQMRPSSVTQLIHDRGLRARAAELRMIRRTRRRPEADAPVAVTVHSTQDGYVTAIDLDALAAAMPEEGLAEACLLVTLGDYVAYVGPLGTVKGDEAARSERAGEALRRAIKLDRERRGDLDATLAIEELGNIAWSTMSSSKHNPQTGWAAVRQLRDLVGRSASQPEPALGEGERVLPIVYADTGIDRLLDTLLSLVVVTAESRQSESAAQVLAAFADGLGVVDEDALSSVEPSLIRTLPAIEEQVLGRPLESALGSLVEALEGRDRGGAARLVEELRARMRRRGEAGTRAGVGVGPRGRLWWP